MTMAQAQWRGGHAGQVSGFVEGGRDPRGLRGEIGILSRLCPAACLCFVPDRTIQLLDGAIDNYVLRRAIAGGEG